MESCNSRQGLLVKSESNVTNSSDYFSGNGNGSSLIDKEEDQQEKDDIVTTPTTSGAQFYIGIEEDIDDINNTNNIEDIFSHFSTNSTALISSSSAASSSARSSVPIEEFKIHPVSPSPSNNKIPLLAAEYETKNQLKSKSIFETSNINIGQHSDMDKNNITDNDAVVTVINIGCSTGNGHPSSPTNNNNGVIMENSIAEVIRPTSSNTSVGKQILAAVFIAAAGNWAAGLILDNGKSWNVFRYTPELYYLVPILLSLKGNLEMTMVARLSTLANLGQLKSFRNIRNILFHNITLVQSQAIIVSMLASVVTLFALRLEGQSPIDLPPPDSTDDLNSVLDTEHGDGSAQIRKILLIFSTSIATANVACLLSSVLMILFTVTLHHLKIDPDNFVTAVAASFGDIITSTLVGLIGEAIYNQIVHLPPDDPNMSLVKGIRYYDDLRTPMPAIWILIGFLLALPFFIWYTCRDHSTKKILLGLGAWIPILMSMLIAFVSGFVLRFGAVDFNFMSLFQPLINGVGGNLAAISASRYSTELHVIKSRQEIGGSEKQIKFFSVLKRSLKSFYAIKDQRNVMILVFIIMAAIVHLFYGILAPIVHVSDQHEITPYFYLFYIPAAMLQVFVLLILTRFAVDIVWSMGCDPDTSAIPILTSMGDILGTVFLYTVFVILRSMGDQSASKPLEIPIEKKLNEFFSKNFTTTLFEMKTNQSAEAYRLSPHNLNNLTSFNYINYLITTTNNSTVA